MKIRKHLLIIFNEKFMWKWNDDDDDDDADQMDCEKCEKRKINTTHAQENVLPTGHLADDARIQLLLYDVTAALCVWEREREGRNSEMTQKASNHGSKLPLRLFSLRPFVRNRQICLRAFPQDANESTKKSDLMCFAEEKFYHWTNQSRCLC